jgi:hypothetical protein
MRKHEAILKVSVTSRYAGRAIDVHAHTVMLAHAFRQVVSREVTVWSTVKLWCNDILWQGLHACA